MSLENLRKAIIETIDRPEIIDRADFYLYPYGKEYLDRDDIVKSEREVYETVKKQFDLYHHILRLVEKYKSYEIFLEMLDQSITDQRNFSVPKHHQ